MGGDTPRLVLRGNSNVNIFSFCLSRSFATSSWRIFLEILLSYGIDEAFLMLPDLALVAPVHGGIWIVRLSAGTMQP